MVDKKVKETKMAGKQKVEVVILDVENFPNRIWTGDCPDGYCTAIMTSSPTKISWVNISYDFGNVSIHVDPDRPCRVEAILDVENQRLQIWLHELPKKRCGNCKLSHEGVCENCAGDNFGSSTEIVSWAEGCENWEKVKQEV